MAVRLWSAKGEALLVDLYEDAPYRRNGAGFRPIEAREFRDEQTDRDHVDGSHVCCCQTGVEAEGTLLEGEEEEDEEAV